MSVFRCDYQRCRKPHAHDAVSVNYWDWIGSWGGSVTEMLCDEAEGDARRADRGNTNESNFWSRYEQLHEPVLGDELCLAVEAFIYQLRHYAMHMPLLLEQRRAA